MRWMSMTFVVPSGERMETRFELEFSSGKEEQG